MSGRVEICRTSKKQLELKDQMVGNGSDERARKKWKNTRLKLKEEYRRGETMQAKDYIAELYGVLAYIDEGNRKI